MRAIILNDTSYENHHGCELVMGNLKSGLKAQGIDVSLSLSLHEDWRVSRVFRKAIQDCQLVVVNGEGTIHSNRPRGIALLEVAPFAKELGIPTALVNASYEGNDPAVCGPLVSEFSLVSFRDSASQLEAGNTVGESRVVPDLSLATKCAAGKGIRKGYGYTDSVSFELTDLLDSILGGDEQFRAMPVLKANASTIKEIVSRLRTRYSVRKLAAFSESPRQVGMALKARRGRILDTNQYVNELSKLEGLVSGRYHSVCMSLLSGTPFVALASNTNKISALLHDCGLSETRVISEVSLSERSWKNGISFSERDEANVREFIGEARIKIERLFSDLRKVAEEGYLK